MAEECGEGGLKVIPREEGKAEDGEQDEERRWQKNLVRGDRK